MCVRCSLSMNTGRDANDVETWMLCAGVNVFCSVFGTQFGCILLVACLGSNQAEAGGRSWEVEGELLLYDNDSNEKYRRAVLAISPHQPDGKQDHP